MIYSELCGERVSSLGFGTMRLPTHTDSSIDEALTEEMIDLAIESGVNYFDTAFPYHGGLSETVVSRYLSKYPRESYFLADKYPGHQISERYIPASIFEKQLKKCDVEYFDFYLLHNVYEGSVGVYLDPKWGILDYFKEQKRLGRIKHLGFSCHGKTELLREFLDAVGDVMEFCQIQLNWVDRTLQDAAGKVRLLNERNIPIVVMEPLRGGRLCTLSDQDTATLKALRPFEDVPAWSFRYLQGVPGVAVTLSGMSSPCQMRENIETYKVSSPLCDEEKSALFAIAEKMKASVPCTACRYCTSECPMKLDIPSLISTYNDLCFEAKTNPAMWLEALPKEKLPSACIGCGKCAKMCPQSIDIPAVMADLSEKLSHIPKWSDICREREEAARRLG